MASTELSHLIFCHCLYSQCSVVVVQMCLMISFLGALAEHLHSAWFIPFRDINRLIYEGIQILCLFDILRDILSSFMKNKSCKYYLS